MIYELLRKRFNIDSTSLENQHLKDTTDIFGRYLKDMI